MRATPGVVTHWTAVDELCEVWVFDSHRLTAPIRQQIFDLTDALPTTMDCRRLSVLLGDGKIPDVHVGDKPLHWVM